MVNGVIFVDLKKAFDTIDHNMLLCKLSFYGFDLATREWFTSYLADRKQQCFVNGVLSDLQTLLFWVPQGTITYQSPSPLAQPDCMLTIRV